LAPGDCQFYIKQQNLRCSKQERLSKQSETKYYNFQNAPGYSRRREVFTALALKLTTVGLSQSFALRYLQKVGGGVSQKFRF
jgi:ABC-type oligopeptide transport system ATPase subunit